MDLFQSYIQRGASCLEQVDEVQWDESHRLELNILFSLRNHPRLIPTLVQVSRSESLDLESRLFALLKICEELRAGDLVWELSISIDLLKPTLAADKLLALGHKFSQTIERLAKKEKRKDTLILIFKSGRRHYEILPTKFPIYELTEEEITELGNYEHIEGKKAFKTLSKLCEFTLNFGGSEPVSRLIHSLLIFTLEKEPLDKPMFSHLGSSLKKYKTIFSKEQIDDLITHYQRISEFLGIPVDKDLVNSGAMVERYLMRLIEFFNESVQIEGPRMDKKIQFFVKEYKAENLVKIIEDIMQNDLKSAGNLHFWKFFLKNIDRSLPGANAKLSPLLSGTKGRKKEYRNSFTQRAHKMITEHLPSEPLRASIHSTFNTIREIVLRIMPNAQVVLYGSYACGTYVLGSNVDVGVLDESVSDPRVTLQEFCALLQESAGVHIDQVFSKQLTLVKVKFQQFDFFFNVMMNNSNSLAMTEILKHMAERDRRVKELVLYVKIWAKDQGIMNPKRGFFSGFHLTLMTIAYLQSVFKPVLPFICKSDVPYDSNRAIAPNFSTRNEDSLGGLIDGFFQLYTTIGMDGTVWNLKMAQSEELLNDGLFVIRHPITHELVGSNLKRNSKKGQEIIFKFAEMTYKN